MTPVEEACAGLFPPMVQKILIINVPRLFAPVWSVISYMLPEHHKERIVLLTTAKTSTEELKKARPLARPLPCCAGVAACIDRRRSWRFATSRAPWSATRECSSTSCTR